MSDHVPVEYPKMILGVTVYNEDEEKIRLDSLSAEHRDAWVKEDKVQSDVIHAAQEKAAKEAEEHGRAAKIALDARNEADAKAALAARTAILTAPAVHPGEPPVPHSPEPTPITHQAMADARGEAEVAARAADRAAAIADRTAVDYGKRAGAAFTHRQIDRHDQ